MNNKTLNAHQQELIKKASIKPDDILKNLDSLNAEIAETYDQELALETATKDKTLQLNNPILTKESDTPMTTETTEPAFDPIAELEKEVEEARKKAEALRKQQEAERADEPEEESEEQLSPMEQQHNAILNLLKSRKDAPTDALIQKWKHQYGQNGINVLALGEDDVYVFTYLRRGQFAKIQELVQAASNSNLNQNPEEVMKEKVIQYTVLWPAGISSPEFLYNSRAGVIDTLYQNILLNSYFLSPQQAMMLTTQL